MRNHEFLSNYSYLTARALGTDMLSFKKKQKQTNKETNVIICEEQPLLSVNYFFLMISYYCSAFISHVKKKKSMLNN